MTRKDVRNIKQLHSKRTGAIILIALAFFLVSSAVFIYLAMEENKAFEVELQRFIALTCEGMEAELHDEHPHLDYKVTAWQNKVLVGEC